MKNKYLVGLLLFFLFAGGASTAQTGLQTEKIFETYGKQKGAILLELATDVLGDHTRMTLYKSLVVPSEDPTVAAIATAIGNDIAGGSKLMETQKNGRTETGYYCLKRNLESKTYEYILYKEKSKKITLVYIRGDFPPHQLENELGKLKDLFVYVNNKRIKLQ